MAKVLVPLAPGFEELEAVTITDLLTRAGIEVVTAGLDEKPVKASRGITIVPDTHLAALGEEPFDMIVLPGGMPGADHLRDDPRIVSLLKSLHAAGKPVAAICAAPKVLAKAGLLTGRRVTHYPQALNALESEGIEFTGRGVEMDGRIITGRGPGTAMDFALQLIEILADKAKRDEVEAGLAR